MRVEGLPMRRQKCRNMTPAPEFQEAAPGKEKIAMYIGIGTVVLIVIIVLIVLMLRRLCREGVYPGSG